MDVTLPLLAKMTVIANCLQGVYSIVAFTMELAWPEPYSRPSPAGMKCPLILIIKRRLLLTE